MIEIGVYLSAAIMRSVLLDVGGTTCRGWLQRDLVAAQDAGWLFVAK